VVHGGQGMGELAAGGPPITLRSTRPHPPFSKASNARAASRTFARSRTPARHASAHETNQARMCNRRSPSPVRNKSRRRAAESAGD
jgi:hypothetical protein